MNGEPSRRLDLLDWIRYEMRQYLLVEKELGMVTPGIQGFADTAYAIWVRLRSLEESTVAAKNVVHAILRCAVKFWHN